MRVASVLRERVAGADWFDDARITVSIGVAQLHRKHTVDSWLKSADDALYRAKVDGRNCVRVATRSRTNAAGELVDTGFSRPSDLMPLAPAARE
jgi:predicted signal transduction protein with EAL and GGDEF domain